MSRTERSFRQLRSVSDAGRILLASQLPGLGSFIVKDVVVVGLGYALMASALFSRLLADLHGRLLGFVLPGTPSDFHGTAWFYWWHAEAHSRSVDVLHPDVVCAPTGQPLGANFPNQLDAMFARLFIDWFDFPAGFNLFLVAIVVAGAMAGYLGLRTLTSSRVVAFIGGAFYGLNAYSISEAAAGRPTLSLVAFIPLFIGCWLQLLAARGGSRWAWGILASLFAVLSVHHYILYALFLVLFAILSGVVRLVIPAKGVSRWRPVMALMLVGTISLCGSVTYLQQLLHWRPPVVLADVERPAHEVPGPPSGAAPSLDNPTMQIAQEFAPSVGYLWGENKRYLSKGNHTQYYIPSILIIAALALLPLSRLRGLGWLGAMGFFYSITLGPAASQATKSGHHYLTLGGEAILLPTYLLFWKLPSAIQVWHCERAFPLVLFCLLACLTVGLERVGRYSRYTRIKLCSPPVRRMLVILLVLPIGHIGLQGLDRVNTHSLVPMTDWSPHPFLEQLAAEDGSFSIIDLPLGLGDGLGLDQIVHRRPRANGHADDIQELLNGNPPSKTCYQLPLLGGLWNLQLVTQGHVPRIPDERYSKILPSTAPSAIQEARDAGFRYVVFFRKNAWMNRHFTDQRGKRRYLASLRHIFGPSLFEDSRLMVWSLDDVLDPPIE